MPTARPRRAGPCLVVGAGPQGLTFALALLRRGRRVVVVDRAPSVGGQARSLRYGGFTFDLGMHALVTRDPAVLALAREALGPEFSRFQPSAATWAGGGPLFADDSLWRCGGMETALYEMLETGRPRPWSCMRIQEPTPVIYPRHGGFGRLCEGLARAVEKTGGTIRLGESVDPSGFELAGGRLAAVRLGGRRLAVSGCYWSAGPTALLRRPAEEAPVGLVLHHFLLKGRAPLPHHWVRLAAPGPLLPPLVYYPGAFAAANVPQGCYSLGAAVPVLAPRGRSPDPASAVLLWHRERPEAFVPLLRRFLSERGFLRDRDVLSVRQERLAVPATEGRRRVPPDLASNFWYSGRWLSDRPGESATAMQMTAALAAAEHARGARA